MFILFIPLSVVSCSHVGNLPKTNILILCDKIVTSLAAIESVGRQGETEKF